MTERAELSTRLEGLPGDRRKLLARLLGTSAAPPPTSQPTLDPEAVRAFHAPGTSEKDATRRFYNTINQQLASTIFGEHSAFLNYGYVADESPRFAVAEAPAHMVNRTSVTLVLELIGDCDLAGKRLLDVGCGRGGTLLVVDQFFAAALKVGLDLSSAAIEFCHRTHRCHATAFLEGDAEQLPFGNGSYDVVTSVESSHSYPDIASFYGEVHRVLRPSGHFLYTDVFAAQRFADHRRRLEGIGFVVERDVDITPNVVLSCRATATQRALAFEDLREPEIVRDFLSVPGSSVFDEMQAGRAVYRILRLRKPERE